MQVRKSPAIRQRKGQISVRKAYRKEKMEEELLFGKYRVLRLLANGSGGEVFLAEHERLGERRIIKRLLKNRPFYEERKREAHTLKLLHHTAVPRIYDIEEDASACYIIEEDMGGETLHDFLNRQKCLSTSFISNYSIQLCEIIEYLHREGILYLDVKPENIMICGEKLTLIDFGGAIRKQEYSGVMFGTQGFAAPEQYNGMAKESSDIYGIGRVIGVMLGEKSKGREELFAIYERCVRDNPEKRYPSVSVLKEELQKVYRGIGKKARRKGRTPGYIGVAGIHDGAECGVFCTLLATYLNDRENSRIACIDMSGKHIFEQFYESMFGTRKAVPDCFFLQGICYVTEGSSAVIGAYAAKGYETILLHFGVWQEESREEFFRCDSRFVLGNLYPWRMPEWKEFAGAVRDGAVRKSITAVITGGEREMLPARFGKVVEMPYVADVLRVDRNIRKLFQTLL